MEQLRDMALKLATKKSRKPLSPSQISIIEESLHQFLPASSHIPTHRPYSSMITEALNELKEKEKGGSTQNAISKFIKTRCDDLPLAHKSCLKHHLKKLCEKGTIILTGKRYSISVSEPATSSSRRRMKRKCGTEQHILEGYSPEFRVNEDYKGLKKDISNATKKNISTPPIPRRILFPDEEELSIGDDDEHAINNRHEIQLLSESYDKNYKKISKDGGSHEESNSNTNEVLSQYQNELCDPVKKGRVDNGGQQLELLQWIEDQPLQVHCQENVTSGDSALLVAPNSRDSASLVAHEKIEKKVIVCGLPAPNNIKQRSTRKKNTRSGRNLVKQVQQLSISHPDSAPSSELSEHKQAEQHNLELSEHKQAEQHNSVGEDSKVIETEHKMWPTWVQTLVHSTFFLQCYVHNKNSRKRKCNIYCLQCNNGPACHFCRNKHAGHKLIQVRQTTSYGDVTKVEDVSEYLDISGIETHTHGNLTVVSLSRKLASKGGKCATKACLVCGRPLPKSFQYCSLRCKDEVMLNASSYPPL